MYVHIAMSYAKMLDRIGRGDREDNNKRRKITLHSFRRFVKSTISDLGYGDYEIIQSGLLDIAVQLIIEKLRKKKPKYLDRFSPI